jgi:hypothetical protein
MDMHKNWHVCVRVCFFFSLFLSLYIQTVPDLRKGSVLETFTQPKVYVSWN